MTAEKENLFRTAYLENTQLIYDGIRKMGKLYTLVSAANLYNEGVSGFITETMTVCRQNGPGESSQTQPCTKYYRHNELSNFFRFVEYSSFAKSLKKESVLIDHISAMLDLFLYISASSLDLPEKYEKVCDAIRKIATTCLENGEEKNAMCYLAYSSGQDHRIIMSSRPPIIYDEYITQRGMLNKLMHSLRLKKSCSSDLEFVSINDTISKLRFAAKGTSEYRVVLSIHLPIKSKQNQHLFLLIELPTDDRAVGHGLEITWTDLQASRDILFLRNTIIKNIQLDIGDLLAFGRSYRYVKPISRYAPTGKRELRIVHISDLHVDAKSNVKKIEASIVNKLVKVETPDLMVITGDVIQGKGTATQLSENYAAARNVIYRIAQNFWGDGEFMRQDWKRRIIITTGNHDYASMNELEVVRSSGSRATGIGRPATKEADINVKFSHYIEFLRKGFDVDIDALIADDLNEVRYYEALGVCVVCLNTSCASNALRNNKVQLSTDFVETLTYRVPPDAPFCICLAHHTPAYKADYVSDKYWSYSAVNGTIITDEKMKTWVNRFSVCLSDSATKCLLSGGADSALHDRNLKELLKEINNTIADERTTGSEAVAQNVEGTELYRDLKYLCNSAGKTTDERRYQILSDLVKDRSMSEQDNKEYRLAFTEAMKTANIRTVLGGHVHAINHEQVDFDGVKISCFEAAKAFTDDYIQYSELCWNGKTCVYRFEYKSIEDEAASKIPERLNARYRENYPVSL